MQYSAQASVLNRPDHFVYCEILVGEVQWCILPAVEQNARYIWALTIDSTAGQVVQTNLHRLKTMPVYLPTLWTSCSVLHYRYSDAHESLEQSLTRWKR